MHASDPSFSNHLLIIVLVVEESVIREAPAGRAMPVSNPSAQRRGTAGAEHSHSLGKSWEIRKYYFETDYSSSLATSLHSL